MKERALQHVLAGEPIPSDVVDKANKAKSSICSDQAYLSAMHVFSQTTSNRLIAVQAEFKIYHDWSSADYINDFQDKTKQASTNANRLNTK